MDLQRSSKKLSRRLLLKILHKIMILAIAAAIPLSAADVPVITLEEALFPTNKQPANAENGDTVNVGVKNGV